MSRATERAALVDPGLTRADRDELETVLKRRYLANPCAVPMLVALLAAGLVLALAFTDTGRTLLFFNMAGISWPVWEMPIVLLAAFLIAYVVTRRLLWAPIPDKFRGHVVTGHPDDDGPYDVGERALIAAVVALGDRENTPCTTNAQVDELWRETWDRVTAHTKQNRERHDREQRAAQRAREQARKEAERDWGATPVDHRMPT